MQSDSPIGTHDHRIREVSELVLELRSDLRFTPHYEAGEECYLVEDVARSQFFTIGLSEYMLISMFDGKTTVGDAMIRLSQLPGNHQLIETEATAICKWLVDSEMAHTPTSSDGRRLANTAVDRIAKKRLGAWNPLCMKVPLAYPDRLVAKVTPWFSFFFSSAAAIIGLIVMCVAAYQVVGAWDQFAAASKGIFIPSRWLWMGLCWVVLKFVHESGHAIVCRKYGGEVHEAGAIMVLFAPLAYVDLTSSWRFRSKWKRIHTALAGMYVELWIASIAAIIWAATDAGFVNDISFNLIMMAGLTTLLFNANPLMRFDGYYVLSDGLGIPNLYSEGQQYLQYLGRRFILGEKVTSPLRLTPRDLFTRAYGVAAFGWRILICVSLVIAASLLFKGLGILLAVAAVLLWVGVPLVRLAKYVRRPDGMQKHRTRRLAFISAAGAAVSYAILGGVMWPGAQQAHAVVQYEPLAFVRATSAGFVRELYVQSGQNVQAGQVIAQLENRQLVAEQQDLELAINQSIIKSRVFKQADEMHSYQGEMEQLRSLQEKLAEKTKQVQELTLRAPAAGRVVARELKTKLGTYVQEGAELAAIGDEANKQLQIAITQPSYDRFTEHIGSRVHIRVSGGVVLQSTLESVQPRADKKAPQDSMYAALGGPLESRSVQSDSGDESFELLTPHFTGVVTLPKSVSQDLRVGQRGVVWFGRYQESLGCVLQRKLRQTIPSNLLSDLVLLDN
ncbi:MAG: HlyD family efflux transporter periplasmic adaptor subunit [Pirellulaceae bacterium]|nr:HlyD family efflux transporter periplasmic adaptor subunit [Pirellulaceae bacterium]